MNQQLFQMRTLVTALAVLIICGILMPACNEPTIIGSDLLEQDKASIGFLDTLSLITTTVEEDSVITFDINSQSSNYLWGSIDDPIFGKTDASIYLQFLLSSVNPDFVSTRTHESRFDSIVLGLAYDDRAFYGNNGKNIFTDILNGGNPVDDGSIRHSMDVLKMEEVLANDQLYYSDQTFATQNTPLGSIENFIPKPDSRWEFIFPFLDGDADADTIFLDPHLRVRLDDNFGQNLFDQVVQNNIFDSDTTLLSNFPGLYLKPTKSAEQLISFNLASQLSRVSIYFTKTDTVSAIGEPTELQTLNLRYDLNLLASSVKIANYDHNNFDGSIVQSYIDDPEQGEEYLFLQSMAGPNIKVDVPYVDKLGDIVINKADITFYVATLAEDEEYFDPIQQLVIQEINSNGDLVLIEDVARSSTSIAELTLDFGGDPIEDSDVMLTKYTMNISAHFQDMVDGISSKTFFIAPLFKNERASRVVFYGSAHPMFAPKINLAFTNK